MDGEIKHKPLLPCPMCGGKADYNWDERDGGIRAWYIHCAPDNSFKGCVAHDGRFATLREAVTHWNTRASLPAQPSDEKRNPSNVIPKDPEINAAFEKWCNTSCDEHPCDLQLGYFGGWKDCLAHQKAQPSDVVKKLHAQLEKEELPYSTSQGYGDETYEIETLVSLPDLLGFTNEDYAKLLAALTTQQAQSREWLPIETAPKDGTEILICCATDDCNGMVVAHWDGAHHYSWQTADGIGYHKEFPTHWMPLPKQPFTQNKGV